MYCGEGIRAGRSSGDEGPRMLDQTWRPPSRRPVRRHYHLPDRMKNYMQNCSRGCQWRSTRCSPLCAVSIQCEGGLEQLTILARKKKVVKTSDVVHGWMDEQKMDSVPLSILWALNLTYIKRLIYGQQLSPSSSFDVPGCSELYVRVT